ncbi:MAG: P63C domain-containing protein [Capsulimonadaceae bacterium]
MNTARTIVEKFGGQTALAGLIGRNQSAVAHWVRSGVVPGKWRTPLLELARTRGIELSLSDFVPVESPPSTDIAMQPTKLPVAQYPGVLTFGDVELPVYVLDTGERVLSRTGATSVLIGKQGGGNLESYTRVSALSEYIPSDLTSQLIEIEMKGVVNKTVLAMTADTFVDICKAYVNAYREGKLTTDKQKDIALQAAFVVSSCAKVGLVALIDEATGYQYVRENDALQVKLKLFLEDDMRKWEKTFPDELWKEFGRLTNWSGALHQRPKYWGKYVMELVYDYLDPDVSKWLKENAPKPIGGKSYHRWLSEQYGLKKLVEHLWMLVGMASACGTMSELRRKMGEKYGRRPVQLTLYLPPPD